MCPKSPQWQRVCINKNLNAYPGTENPMLCTEEIINIRLSGGNNRNAVFGAKNFIAYPQNKNSCAQFK